MGEIRCTEREINTMADIQYVIDEHGQRVAVQIPIAQWEIIQAELARYDGDEETAEIMADPELVEAIKRGREQARRKIGRPLAEVEL